MLRKRVPLVAVTIVCSFGISYCYQPARSTTADVYIASWSPKLARVTGTPALAFKGYAGITSGPDWSPNGDKLIAQIGTVSNPNGVNLLIHSVSTGEERTVHPKLAMFSRPRFGKDGRTVVAQGRSGTNEWAIYEIDLENGEYRTLVTAEAVINPQWSRDGTRLLYEQNFDSVLLRARVTGQTVVVYRSPEKSGGRQTNLNAALSADGRMVAVVDGSSLYVVAAEGGPPKRLLDLKEGRFLFPGSLTWTADGRWLLFGKMNGATGELWKISPQGGAPEAAGFAVLNKYIYFLRMSPNGESLAFSVGDNMLR